MGGEAPSAGGQARLDARIALPGAPPGPVAATLLPARTSRAAFARPAAARNAPGGWPRPCCCPAHNLCHQPVIRVWVRQQQPNAGQHGGEVEAGLPRTPAQAGGMRAVLSAGARRAAAAGQGRRAGPAAVRQAHLGGMLRMSRQMRPSLSTLGWYTGVMNLTLGGSKGYLSAGARRGAAHGVRGKRCSTWCQEQQTSVKAWAARGSGGARTPGAAERPPPCHPPRRDVDGQLEQAALVHRVHRALRRWVLLARSPLPAARAS